MDRRRAWLLAAILLLPALAGCVTTTPPDGQSVEQDPASTNDTDPTAPDDDSDPDPPADPPETTDSPTEDPPDPPNTTEPAPEARAQKDRPWPVLPDAIWRSDLQRTGVLPNAAVPQAADLAWSYPGINKGEHTAAKASGLWTGELLLVPGDTGAMTAFHANGSVAWAVATWPSSNGIHGTPTVAAGVAFIGSYEGGLYAYDLDDGALLWRTGVGDAIGSSPAYYDGKVYVSVETHEPSGQLAVLDAATGELLFMDRRITDHPHSSVALDPEGDVLVVGANDGMLYAWNLSTLEHRWTVEIGREIKGPIALHDGAAFFGAWDDNVYRVNVTDGSVTWKVETGMRIMGGAAVDAATDTVYIGSFDDHVYALNATTGQERWRFETGGWVLSSPVVADGTVLVGSYDEHLYALEASTGEELWRYKGQGRVTSSVELFDGQVAFTERADEGTGKLYVLGP